MAVSNKQKSIIINNLKKIYSKREVVSDVSLELKKGEVVGLLGPNGAGKTTTFYMITGMIKPLTGTINLDSLDITHMPMYKRALNKIGYLAQEPSVFTRLSVEDNIMLVLEMIEKNEKKRKKRLEELLEEFSITHIRKSKAYTLSGGERRRVGGQHGRRDTSGEGNTAIHSTLSRDSNRRLFSHVGLGR